MIDHRKKPMPEEVYKAIQTPLGVLHGRDAISIDSLHYAPQDGGALHIVGQINGVQASQNPQGLRQVVFDLYFDEVQVFNVMQVDTYGYGGGSVSSFDQVFHSRWRWQLIQRQRGTVTGQHTHYHLRTYDDVLDIIALSFTMTLRDPNNSA